MLSTDLTIITLANNTACGAGHARNDICRSGLVSYTEIILCSGPHHAAQLWAVHVVAT